MGYTVIQVKDVGPGSARSCDGRSSGYTSWLVTQGPSGHTGRRLVAQPPSGYIGRRLVTQAVWLHRPSGYKDLGPGSARPKVCAVNFLGVSQESPQSFLGVSQESPQSFLGVP